MASKTPSTKKEMIQHAAMICASREQGFHGTSTKKLEGRYSESTYYAVFGTKQGLLREMFHEFWGGLGVNASVICQAVSDPVEQLRALLILAVEFFRENEHLFRVTTMTCYPRGEESERPRGCDHALRFKRYGLRAILRAKKEGRLRAPDCSPNLIYLALVGALQQVLNAHYVAKHHGVRQSVGQGALELGDIKEFVNTLVDSFFVPREWPTSVACREKK